MSDRTFEYIYALAYKSTSTSESASLIDIQIKNSITPMHPDLIDALDAACDKVVPLLCEVLNEYFTAKNSTVSVADSQSQQVVVDQPTVDDDHFPNCDCEDDDEPFSGFSSPQTDSDHYSGIDEIQTQYYSDDPDEDQYESEHSAMSEGDISDSDFDDEIDDQVDVDDVDGLPVDVACDYPDISVAPYVITDVCDSCDEIPDERCEDTDPFYHTYPLDDDTPFINEDPDFYRAGDGSDDILYPDDWATYWSFGTFLDDIDVEALLIDAMQDDSDYSDSSDSYVSEDDSESHMFSTPHTPYYYDSSYDSSLSSSDSSDSSSDSDSDSDIDYKNDVLAMRPISKIKQLRASRPTPKLMSSMAVIRTHSI